MSELAAVQPETTILASTVKSDRHEVMFHSDAFERPETWGLILADIARFVASGIAEDRGGDRNDLLRSIVEMMLKEIPSDECDGPLLALREQ